MNPVQDSFKPLKPVSQICRYHISALFVVDLMEVHEGLGTGREQGGLGLQVSAC